MSLAKKNWNSIRVEKKGCLQNRLTFGFLKAFPDFQDDFYKGVKIAQPTLEAAGIVLG